MSSLQFCVSLNRANPAVFRVLSVPGSFTFGELSDLICISFGLSPQEAELSGDSGAPLSQDDRAAEKLKPGESMTVTLPEAPDSTRKLIFYADYTGEAQDKTPGIPTVEEVYGNQLPAGVFDISVINRIHQEREASFQYRNQIYTNETLRYSARKTENDIRVRFAPETAKKMVNANLGLPLNILASNLKNQDLKYILDTLGCVYGSQARKAELVYHFCDYWHDTGKYGELISNLPLGEFLVFRELCTESRLPGSISDLLPTLYDTGLIARTKIGVLFAGELLNYYEAQLEKHGDDWFLKQSALRTALSLCISTYGLFDERMFLDLLKALIGGGVSEEDALHFLRGCPYPELRHNERKDFYFSCNEFDTGEAADFWSRILHGPGCCYLPDREELMRKGRNFFIISDKNRREMIDLYNYMQRSYFYYDDPEKKLIAFFYFWHKGGERRDAAEYINDNLMRYWNRISDRPGSSEARFLDLWAEESRNFPQVLLGGYSRENCPKHILLHQKEAEAERKRKEAEWEAKAQEMRKKGRKK